MGIKFNFRKNQPKNVRPTGGPGNGKKMKPLGNSGSSAVFNRAKTWS